MLWTAQTSFVTLTLFPSALIHSNIPEGVWLSSLLSVFFSAFVRDSIPEPEHRFPLCS